MDLRVDQKTGHTIIKVPKSEAPYTIPRFVQPAIETFGGVMLTARNSTRYTYFEVFYDLCMNRPSEESKG